MLQWVRVRGCNVLISTTISLVFQADFRVLHNRTEWTHTHKAVLLLSPLGLFDLTAISEQVSLSLYVQPETCLYFFFVFNPTGTPCVLILACSLNALQSIALFLLLKDFFSLNPLLACEELREILSFCRSVWHPLFTYSFVIPGLSASIKYTSFSSISHLDTIFSSTFLIHVFLHTVTLTLSTPFIQMLSLITLRLSLHVASTLNTHSLIPERLLAVGGIRPFRLV